MKLEIRDQKDETGEYQVGKGTLLLTPPIGGDYWKYRVMLSDKQAMLGFPKFGTLGIGFAVEEDWNTNLPYGVGALRIFEHIKHNKGDESISDADCIAAIKMIQEAVRTALINEGLV